MTSRLNRRSRASPAALRAAGARARAIYLRLLPGLGKIRPALHRVSHREIVTELAVAAPPAVVWRVLTEFASYPSWNPFMPSVTGEARPGRRLRAVALPARGPGMSFQAVITSAQPAAELRWTGVLFWRWLFHGHHYFVLEEIPGPVIGRAAAGRVSSPGTLLRHGEVMGGVLTPLAGAVMASWMRPGFERMNRALGERAEEAAVSVSAGAGAGRPPADGLGGEE